MRRMAFIFLFACLFLGQRARATVFGQVEGIVHDPQHRPVSGAQVVLKSATSDFSQRTQTNDDGAFRLSTIPAGDYRITISQSGFRTLEEQVVVASNTLPILHFELSVAGVEQSAVVTAETQTANVDSVTPTTLVS